MRVVCVQGKGTDKRQKKRPKQTDGGKGLSFSLFHLFLFYFSSSSSPIFLGHRSRSGGGLDRGLLHPGGGRGREGRLLLHRLRLLLLRGLLLLHRLLRARANVPGLLLRRGVGTANDRNVVVIPVGGAVLVLWFEFFES